MKPNLALRVSRCLGVLALLAGCGGGPADPAPVGRSEVAPSSPKPSPTPSPGDASGAVSLVVLFKLDPSVRGGGTYGGDIWVAPPTYTLFLRAQATATIEARAEGLDVARQTVQVDPAWSSDDEALVRVTPARGAHVTVSVRGIGRTAVHVTAGAVAKALWVTSVYQGDLLRIDVSQ